MSRTDCAVTNRVDAAPLRHAVRKSYRWRAELGMKSDHAFDDAGQSLGVTGRFIRALVRDEVFWVAKGRYDRMMARWWVDMERQAAAHRAIAEQIEREAEAAEAAKQLNLDLGDRQCFARSTRKSASGGTDDYSAGPLFGGAGI